MSALSLLRNWRVAFALLALLIALGSIALNGINFGIDFQGGTLFQIHLAEPVSDPQLKDQIRKIIQFRSSWNVLIQIARQ